MTERGRFEVVRDPLWNNIGLDPEALGVLDSEPVQRLRYVRQLGHAFLVYPGATHTRFEHALGTYHLARRTLSLLRDRGDVDGIDEASVTLVRLAAMLHDVGHYPFSHALEEAGLPSHEGLAAQRMRHPELAAALEATGIPRAAERITALIDGTSTDPLQGLISGDIDLDKIEYLTRDAHMCGVPYGTVDVDRLMHSLTLVNGEAGPTVGMHEKGVAALESLLFAKYQMYRNVYWHHAIRSATAMFKRCVRDAIARHQLHAEGIAETTDEALMEVLRGVPDAPLATQLRRRRLHKRVLDIPAADLPDSAGAWVSADPDLVALVEDRLAAECGLPSGGLLLDYPRKPAMLASNLPVVTRHGEIAPARLSIAGVAEDLHRAARRLRVFSNAPVVLDRNRVLSLVEMNAADVRAGL